MTCIDTPFEQLAAIVRRVSVTVVNLSGTAVHFEVAGVAIGRSSPEIDRKKLQFPTNISLARKRLKMDRCCYAFDQH